MSGGRASDPVELLQRLHARGGSGGAGTAAPLSSVGVASACELGGSNPGGPVAEAPGTPTGPGAARAAALLRAVGAETEAPATPDPDLTRERAETAAGLRGEVLDPVRAGKVEVLPNGTRLHHCRTCGRVAAWGFGVALDRGRDGTWFCFEHQGRAG